MADLSISLICLFHYLTSTLPLSLTTSPILPFLCCRLSEVARLSLVCFSQPCSSTGESASLPPAPLSACAPPLPRIGNICRNGLNFVRIDQSADNDHRRNSQKPSDELVRNFKDNFPQLNPGRIVTTASAEASTSLADALDSSVNSRYGLPISYRRCS